MLKEKMSQLFASCDENVRRQIFALIFAWEKGKYGVIQNSVPCAREYVAECECQKKKLHKAAHRRWGATPDAKLKYARAYKKWLNAVAALAIIESLANAVKALQATNDNERYTIAARIRISLIVASNLLRQAV